MAEGYQVIARRWRPRQFDELVGQDHIVRTLKHAIEQNRIAHAYLFVGPRGTGKTTTARLLAKALNAEGGPKITPPEDSPISQAIMNGNCMDVMEIDGASHNSVDQVRELRENCQYVPAQCTFKIYIIDEVHMLSTAAFNALLKILEEPPPHVKFIFATTESQKVLPTITSRCQRFEFRPIGDEVIAQKLSVIAEAEKIQVEDSVLNSIARLAQGGMRDAQSALDQMISFCSGTIKASDVLDAYGLVAPEQIVQLAKAIVTADLVNLIAQIDNLAKEGRDLYRLLLDLQSLIREELVEAMHNKGYSKKLEQTCSNETLMRILDALHTGEASVRNGLSAKVNFEVTLLRAVEQSRCRSIDTLIHEISSIAAQLPSNEHKKKLKIP